VGILEILGITGRGGSAEQQTATGHGDTDTVRRIVGELEALEPPRARFLAAFAYVLSRVAHADSHISEEETESMREVVQKLGHLPEAQALLVVEIAKSQARLFGGTENYLVTREFREIATATQRLELLDCIFAVAAADGSISAIEESQAGQIAKELGFTQPDYASALAAHAEHRTVLRGLRAKKHG
jgi:uncharacterized tellurite resistance protein B-like protein|tara:strand:- start:986 stop:1543 length:558 start_codon:yes stop_codon:yes gene_type:complete